MSDSQAVRNRRAREIEIRSHRGGFHIRFDGPSDKVWREIYGEDTVQMKGRRGIGLDAQRAALRMGQGTVCCGHVQVN